MKDSPSPHSSIALIPLDFELRTRILYGPGKLNQVGEMATCYGGHKILLVTDKGLAQAGHEARCLKSLVEAGCDVTVFDDVYPNPSTEDVERGLKVAQDAQIDMIIGLGGGSSMDCAKGINFLYTNGGRIQDYWGVGKASKPMLPFIAIPTTSGTGSEAQSFALISDAKTHVKMACGDKKSSAKVAILDPELTLTMPAPITAVTGIDAISHALETYVTTKRNSISQVFSKEAWKLLASGFAHTLQEPFDIEARGKMLLGAHYAGMAIEQSMLGATHALANPLTANFNTTHGIAIGLMLPHVVMFNSQVVLKDYIILAKAINLQAENDQELIQLLCQFITRLVADAGCPTQLRQLEIPQSMIPQLAEEASKQWTGTFNPRPCKVNDFIELYQAAW